MRLTFSLRRKKNKNITVVILRKTVLSNECHTSTMKNPYCMLLKTVSLAMHAKIIYQRDYNYYEVFFFK